MGVAGGNPHAKACPRWRAWAWHLEWTFTRGRRSGRQPWRLGALARDFFCLAGRKSGSLAIQRGARHLRRLIVKRRAAGDFHFTRKRGCYGASWFPYPIENASKGRVEILGQEKTRGGAPRFRQQRGTRCSGVVNKNGGLTTTCCGPPFGKPAFCAASAIATRGV
jgi:hypothetical protein